MEDKNTQNELEELKNELEKVKLESEHLKRQLRRAVNLRFHLMPSVFPMFPDLPMVDVYGDQIGMAHVGGDFFDIFRIDSDHIGLMTADIFGGGDAAALFMVAFKLYIMGELSMGFSPDKLMQVVNNRLARANEDDLCLSAWYGVYEISTGKVVAVNAGHESPIVLKSDGKAQVATEDDISYIMGVMEGIDYTAYEIQLNVGDVLLIYTDGLTKAKNPDGTNYSPDDIIKVMENNSGADSEDMVAAIQGDLLSYVKDVPLNDDVTLLCLKRKEDTL